MSKCETQFVDDKTLIVKADEVQNLDSFTVKQLWKGRSVVSTSDEYIYIATDGNETGVSQNRDS